MGTPTLAIDGARAEIALGRPDKHNRIEPDDLAEIDRHLAAIEADPVVRVVTLTAEGRSWCSGFHLGAFADGERPKVGFGDVCDRLAACRAVTIAVLAGNVLGGGTDLALSCDFRMAADTMSLTMPAAKIGLQYYPSGLHRFVSRIGPDATKRIFLTAQRIDAAELLRLGYLTDAVPADDLEAAVDDRVAAVCSTAPLAAARTKAAIESLATESPDWDAIEAGARETSRSNDHREALVAMRENRPPQFTGT